MRILVAISLALAVCGCTADKYSETPKASGPWIQANPDPDSTDNNIVPLSDLDDNL